MPYILIEDFKYGIDRRRPRYAGVPGTLWDAKNCHLSRGGDLERCKAFKPVFTNVSNTFGLGAIGGQVYVFGSADLAGTLPVGVQYQRLQAPSGAAMTRVFDAKLFDNKFYVIAGYADGSRHHFYDGARVTDWDTVADGLATALLTYRAIALEVALSGEVSAEPEADGVVLTSLTPGTAFTISASATNGTGTNDQTASVTQIVANVPGVAAVEATASVSVVGGSFDPGVNQIYDLQVKPPGSVGQSIIAGPVNWVSSDDTTATALALAVNESSAIHGYSAVAVGSSVVVTAPDESGAAINGYTLLGVTEGNAALSAGSSFAGGSDAVEAVAQVEKVTFGGTFEPDDTLEITINGTAYALSGRAAATGTAVHVQDSRVWSPAGPALVYCKLNDPTDWTDTTATIGAGSIVVATDSDGAQILTGIASFQGFAAVFAENAVVIYALGTDPDVFERVQEVPNSGTRAGRAVSAYGASDVFFADETGVRSLRARDSSNAAFVDDAGTAFDPFVQDLYDSVTPRTVADALSLMEPRTGAYWLAIGSTILVLTNYPGTKIRGWTYYAPGFNVTGMARVGKIAYLRSSDTIYAYGGLTGAEYPAAGELPVEIEMPFLAARDEAGLKQFTGIDIGGQNLWHLLARVNPKDLTETIDLGYLDGVTYADENAEAIGETSHLALRLTCNSAGPASISNMALHHNGEYRA